MTFALQIITYAAIAATILIVLPEVFSRMIYHRSFISTLAEIYLRLCGRNPTGEQAKKELAQRSQKDDLPYSLPKGLKFIVSVERFDIDGMPVYLLNGKGKGATVVYFHGGGYVRNPISLHYRFCDKLAKRTNCRIIIPIYPKSPKHCFKACYDALLPLCKRVLNECEKVEFMGDSSGGGLAVGLYQSMKQTEPKLPEKLVLFAPWVDLTMSNPLIPEYDKVDPRNSKSLATVWANAWACGGDLKDYRLSPIYGDLALDCEVHIFVGMHDMLYPDCQLFHEKLIQKGTKSYITVKDGLNHVYPIYPTPEGRAALKQVAKIIG